MFLSTNGEISFPPNFCNFVLSKNELIIEVFSNNTANHKNKKWLSDWAILAATNKCANDLNFIIQNHIVDILYTSKSIDCATHEDEANYSWMSYHDQALWMCLTYLEALAIARA
ncbi:hypothetical protein WA026_011248 [Henosepilachna vigintioctopunctata]|uniref:DNA helicase n=1 Tax=Henosepilachna vigintioctopunctata TaxID=420089 RepID=A0AAW1TX14_9CUCU